MVTPCKELWTNGNFLLKFAVFICLCILIPFGHYYGYYNLVFGYEHSNLTIITALMIAYWLFESTKFTELCLLVVALIKLLAALIIDATRARADYSCEKPEIVKEVATPEPTVDTRIKREPNDDVGVTTLVNFMKIISEKGVKSFRTLSTKSRTSSNSNNHKVAQHIVPSDRHHEKRYASYRFAAPPTDDSWDNTSENIQFYVHIVICVIAIILTAIDIFLRAKK